MAPLKKDKEKEAMEAACQNMADELCFCPPLIPHDVAVVVMDLDFHIKDPNGVGNTPNIFLSSDLPPSTVLEAVILKRKYEKIVGGGEGN